MNPSTPRSCVPKAGAVCWARRGSPPSIADNEIGQNGDKAEVDSAEFLWWPCIVYPSWSYAALESGLMPRVSHVDTKTDSSKRRSNGILIQGCRKKIAVEHLAKNMVPLKAALLKRNLTEPRQKKRVVAHFLGLDLYRSSVANWAAVSVDGLRPYKANATEMLSLYQGKIHRSEWIDLLRAMEEAAVVLEDPNMKPKQLMLQSNLMQKGDAPGQTPEFFDDWKSGESQSQSQRTTQFSQAGNFGAAAALMELGRHAEDTQKEGNSNPSEPAEKAKSVKVVRIMGDHQTESSSTLAQKSPPAHNKVAVVSPIESSETKQKIYLVSSRDIINPLSKPISSTPLVPPKSSVEAMVDTLNDNITCGNNAGSGELLLTQP